MKKVILIMLLLGSALCLRTDPYAPEMPHPQQIAKIPMVETEAPLVGAPAKAPTPEEIDLAKMEEELADMDHELKRAGFPEVLQDARLSEREQAEIVDKMVRANLLYTRILNRKMRL